jgi:hypothetical protein
VRPEGIEGNEIGEETNEIISQIINCSLLREEDTEDVREEAVQ